jgi:FixJ family two-component response regulator
VSYNCRKQPDPGIRRVSENLQRLRQYQSATRVLFTLGNADAVTLCPSAVEGDFIEKPFSHQLLAKKIAEILGLGQEQ